MKKSPIVCYSFSEAVTSGATQQRELQQIVLPPVNGGKYWDNKLAETPASGHSPVESTRSYKSQSSLDVYLPAVDGKYCTWHLLPVANTIFQLQTLLSKGVWCYISYRAGFLLRGATLKSNFQAPFMSLINASIWVAIWKKTNLNQRSTVPLSI